jgi:signal transduction histidine kinase
MKKFQSIGVLLSAITGLLVVLLVSVFTYTAMQAFDRRESAVRLLKTVAVLNDVFAAEEKLRLEQGEINTALAMPLPADAGTRAQIARMHAESAAAIIATRNGSQLESGSLLVPNHEIIIKARTVYDQRYDAAMKALALPAATRPAYLHDAWPAAINAMVTAINLRTRERSMYIADSSNFNNEMAKIIRIVWSVRETIGRDRRHLAESMILGKQLTSEDLQTFAEQDGTVNYGWSVLENDKTDLPTFPAALKKTLDDAQRINFQQVRVMRRHILDAMAVGRTPPVSVARWLSYSDEGLKAITDISRASFHLTTIEVTNTLNQANQELNIALTLMVLSISLASFTLLYVILRVIRPLRAITSAMQAVAGSNLDHAIPFQNRRDEIGQFAQSLRHFRDNVIEKNRLEKELRDNQVAKDTAEASSKVKSQFLANMSHELRTPLNAIIGFSDLLQNQMFGPLQKQYRDYATIIHESGNHLLNLVSDILDIAKIEAGKFVLDFQDVDLTESVAYCVRLVKNRADEQNIKLVTLLPAQGLRFKADQRAFRQVLLNLLTNAVKFSRAGGEVEVSARVTGGRLALTVKDRGIGMSESLLARIGQPFEQANNDPAHAREGTGLGLSLVHSLIAQHGGRITIESREGAGTAVTCELPLEQPASMPEAAEAAA